jgi:ankyrin repeat protein
MQPLGWAAAKGNYELCEWLISKKARVIGTDKFKRSPLIMAVRNGHLKVASLLLQRGADWAQADSSSNTPLHFAAAYGWQDCIDLLLKAGAEINAENSWKVTPINIAMLKNHEGCVKKFLSCPDVDVNCKDEKGRTLLTTSLLAISERTVDFLKYLLDKGADPNIADIDEQTALHYLAALDFERHRDW